MARDVKMANAASTRRSYSQQLKIIEGNEARSKRNGKTHSTRELKQVILKESALHQFTFEGNREIAFSSGSHQQGNEVGRPALEQVRPPAGVRRLERLLVAVLEAIFGGHFRVEERGIVWLTDHHLGFLKRKVQVSRRST